MTRRERQRARDDQLDRLERLQRTLSFQIVGLHNIQYMNQKRGCYEHDIQATHEETRQRWWKLVRRQLALQVPNMAFLNPRLIENNEPDRIRR